MYIHQLVLVRDSVITRIITTEFLIKTPSTIKLLSFHSGLV
jgi:hypothetical protein